MAYQTPNNRGNLFKNQEKSQEGGPDYSGELVVDGVAYFLDGWLNDGTRGKYMSVRVKRKNKQPETPFTEAYDTEIPF